MDGYRLHGSGNTPYSTFPYPIPLIQYKDFTLDPNKFPKAEMNKFVDNLHSNGQHYGILTTNNCHGFSIPHSSVVIVDPGIKNEQGYPAYDQGLKENAFIKVSVHHATQQTLTFRAPSLSLSLPLPPSLLPPSLSLSPLPSFFPRRIRMVMCSLVRCGLGILPSRTS